MSHTMNKEIQNIHYCTILSAGQWDFLLEGRFSPLRQKCLYRLMKGAVRTRTDYKIKGIDIVLEVGQVAASDVELADFLDCNRKTVGKLIDSFNRLGMLTTKTNNRTSVHSLHFLTGWYVGGVLVTNPHYVRPSAAAKGQTGDARTPVSDSLPSGDEPGGAAVDCHTRGKKINMEFKRNNQLYKNIYNPIYKRFIAASQILIDFLKYPFGDYFCYLF